MKTKYGTETDEKAIQRLLHLAIDPIYSHQMQTLLWMQRSHADRSLLELSLEWLCQSLTYTEADAHKQP